MTEKSEKRKLQAVLFADITGYTALMQKDEAVARQLLDKFHFSISTQVDEHNGQVVNNYGDGCVCTFDSAVSAVQCAKELQIEFQSLPKVPVRIGLHSGDVVYEKDNVYGDSVNIASRIESMSMPGAVLFSKTIHNQIKNQANLKVELLGEFAFKNVEESISIFALANDGFVVPNKEELKGKGALVQEKEENFSKRTKMAVGFVTLLLLAFFVMNNNKKSQEVTTTDVSEKSIAVLPFDDMSPGKDQAYFADGMAEEILNTLAKLDELKVAGRTSSFSFKNKKATISEIGRALHVNHVLEGSIRKHGDKIRVTAQLIKVEDGFHIWSETYDRSYTDVFAIQDELAQKIGEVLLNKLAPEQIAKLSNDIHRNSEAYELFLKAKHIHVNRYYGSLNIEDFNYCEELFLKAIALDSNYALAHAGLADLYDTHRYVLTDTAEMVYYEELKLKESEKAIQLSPDIPYVQLVRGWCLRNKQIDMPDFKGAFNAFLKAYQLDPNSSEGLEGLGWFYHDKSLMDDGMQFFDKWIELSPTNSMSYGHKAQLLRHYGAFDMVIPVCEKSLDFDPSNMVPLRVLAEAYFFLNRKEDALAIYEQIQQHEPSFLESPDNHLKHQIMWNLLKGDIAKAQSINPDSWVISYYNRDLDKLEEQILGAYTASALREENVHYSHYLRLVKHPVFNSFRDKPAFQKILAKEKVKYDRFLKEYPRADEIILNTLK